MQVIFDRAKRWVDKWRFSLETWAVYAMDLGNQPPDYLLSRWYVPYRSNDRQLTTSSFLAYFWKFNSSRSPQVFTGASW